MTDTTNSDFFFIVEVKKDGTIQTHAEWDDAIKADRLPSTFDIFKVCKEITSDIESQLLTDRIVGSILNVLNQREATVSDKVADALKSRGVEFNAGEQVIPVTDAEVVED